jgi:hypothetical protein
MARQVEFSSKGIKIAGELYLPAAAAPDRKGAAVVIGHPNGAVKGRPLLSMRSNFRIMASLLSLLMPLTKEPALRNHGDWRIQRKDPKMFAAQSPSFLLSKM